MNQSDFRMGWPAALNCIPLEPRKAHVTPPRSTHGSDEFESEQWYACLGNERYLLTEADCRQVKTKGVGDISWSAPDWGKVTWKAVFFTSDNGAAQAPRSESVRHSSAGCLSRFAGATPARDESTTPEAAPPSTTDKPQAFKVGDRVRVLPGYIEGDPYAPGTIVSISDFVYVQHDAPLKERTRNDVQGWFATSLVLDEAPQADAGWIPWDPREEKKPPKDGVYVDLKTKTTGEYKRQLYGPKMHWWWSGEIVAYRIAKDPA